jgi:hypothetical protein
MKCGMYILFKKSFIKDGDHVTKNVNDMENINPQFRATDRNTISRKKYH